MMRLISENREAQSRTETQASFQEVCPLPVAFLVAAALFLGDVAVAVAAFAAIG